MLRPTKRRKGEVEMSGMENSAYQPDATERSFSGKERVGNGQLPQTVNVQQKEQPATMVRVNHHQTEDFRDDMFTNVIAVTRNTETDKPNTQIIKQKKTDRKQKTDGDIASLPVKRPEREKGKRVRINVSGRRFETYESTLTSKEGSIFSMHGISRYFDHEKNEYYFERDSRSFEAIFTYLQCGVADKPEKVTYKVFLEEMQFFGFGEIAQRIYNDKCAGFQKIKIKDADIKSVRGYIYHVLEYPGFNTASRVLSLFSALVILLSTTCICMETVPWIRNSPTKQTLNHVQLACVLWFTIETLTRFICCSDRKKFLKSFANIIDICSFLPVYILLIVGVKQGVYLAPVLRFLRITRCFQAFSSPKKDKNPKFLRQLNTIMMSLAASMSDLLTCCSLILFVMVLFSCLLYVIEFQMEKGDDAFSDVPKIFWFSLVTLTSLGYGEVSPLTTGGKLVTTLMIGCTIMVLALPVPIIVSNFMVANDLMANDKTVATFYFDEKKSDEVKAELQHSVKFRRPDGSAGDDVLPNTSKITTTEC